MSPVFLLVLLCREGIKGENGESRKLSCALNQSGDFLGASSIQKFHRKSGLRPQSEEESSHRTSDCGVLHVHVRQLRAVLERLDVACGVAVTSTNEERGMRPQGREVEKRVGSALSVTPKEWEIPQEKRTGPQSEEESSRLTFDFGATHAHLGQTRATGENLDVTCTKNLIC